MAAAVLAALLTLSTGEPADAGLRPRLKVYVGYMDTHTRPISPRQPRIWPYRNKHRFVGTPCRHYGRSRDCWDASAIRLDNPGDRPLRVHVTVLIGDHVYSLWGWRQVAAHSRLVLTETGRHHDSQNFDGSDEAPNDYNGGADASCKNSGAIPRVIVKIGHRRVRTYHDKRQILNAGGVDNGHCEHGHYVPGRRDESHRWVRVWGHLRRQ